MRGSGLSRQVDMGNYGLCIRALAATIRLLEAGAIPKDESLVVCVTGNGYKTAHVVADRQPELTKLGRSLREFEAFMDSRALQPTNG